MRYILFCEDKADGESLRLANRTDHLAWANSKADSIHLAGPMLSDDGERMLGSVFIIEADSVDEVRALNKEDPYTRAGLWGNVVIHGFRQVIPAA